MITGLIGKKLEQTRIFTEDGQQIPVTHILAGPCVVTQVKSVDRDGYNALQIGFGTAKRMTKPRRGHLNKTGKVTKNFPRFLREFRVIESDTTFAPGDTIAPDAVFTPGDTVKVTGVSKGKGFAGSVKRHGFAGGPKTHGQSDRQRAPGSIGAGTTPGRVYKGKRMPGRMGVAQATISGLSVIAVDSDNHVLTVKGVVPGNRNNIVFVQKQ